MTTCAQGFAGRIGFLQGSSPYTWSNAVRVPFWHESIQYQNTIGVPDVIVGSRTVPSERARFGPGVYGGWVYLPVSPKELDTLLPLILGTAEVSDVFAVAETVPAFGVIIDKVTDIFGYHNGVVNQAIFSATQSGPGAPPNFLTLAMECFFKDEDGTIVSFPNISLGTNSTYVPYVFEDCVTTINSIERTPLSWAVMIHNHIHRRHVANLKPVTLCPTRRTVGARFRFPYDDDHDDLHGLALAGVAADMVLTNGTLSTTFDFPCLQAPSRTPFITGHEEIHIDVNFVARGLGTAKEIEITNDSTA